MKCQIVDCGEKTKKGQLKIQQMVFMLIAVTFFLILVGILVLSVKLSGIKESATNIEEEQAILLSEKLVNSPEFACLNAFGENRINCIDADKLMMLKQNINKFSGLFEVLNIEVRKIYPELKKDIICTVDNYPDCNIIKLNLGGGQGFTSSNFVSLCRKESFAGRIYDKCELAKIILTYKDWRSKE